MEKIKLNNAPIRTCENYLSNNISIEKNKIINNKNITEFNDKNINLKIDEKIKIEKNIKNTIKNNPLKYGNGKILEEQINNYSNVNLKLVIDGKINDSFIEFKLDEKNNNLIENIEIDALENAKGNIYIKYFSENKNNKKLNEYHNGKILVNLKENSDIKIILINLLNENNSINLLSVEANEEKEASLDFNIIDLGAENSIINYYSNLSKEKSNNNLNSIYLGKNNKIIDLNYIIEMNGEKSKANIEVQGAIKDNVKKNFKGTIDFKRGCKGAIGEENENCILLSDTAKSLANPMLLCEEEDVEGAHSTSTGKIGEKELFYIMSRGFELKEALKLMVRAKFNQILETIENVEIREEIIKEIDEKLN